MGKRFTKLVGIILVAAMLLPLIPASLASSDDGNPFKFNTSGFAGGNGIFKNEVINQIEHLTDYYYYEGRLSNGWKDPWYLTGSPAVRFISFENNGGTWSSGVYVVPLPTANLSPELTFKSGNGGNWNIKFKNRSAYNEYIVDPEAEVVISCNFSNKNGYLKIGNRSVSGKGRKQLAVKIKDMSDVVIEIGGNKKTKVSGVYGYVRDNNAPYIKSVDVTQDGTNLVVSAISSEAIYIFGDDCFDEWDRTYVDVTIVDARTGGNTTVLRAYIKRINSDVITFEAPLGEWANKDYTVKKLSPSTLKTISGTTTYDLRELIYDYEWMRGNYPAISTSGCELFERKNVSTVSTFMCDTATNPFSLGNITRTMNKTFDNTTPSVTGVSISVPGKILNTTVSSDKTQWPEDLKLSDLYACEGDSVYFKITTDEALYACEGIKLLLNVNDEYGKQVVLDMNRVSTTQTTYGIPQSVIEFSPMVIKDKYSMMSGYEDTPIRALDIKYTKAQDKAGHNLITTGLGAPDQKLYLDFDGPIIEVTKLDYPANSPHASFKVDVSDGEAGIAGANSVVTLKDLTGTGLSFRYLVSTNMSAPDDAAAYTTKAQLAGNGTVQIPVMLQAQHEYTYYVHLLLEPGVEQIVKEVTASVTASDVLDNSSSTGDCTSDYTYDNISPATSILSLKNSYTSSGSNNVANLSASFEAKDHNEIVALQYAWKLDDATAPDEETGWSVADISCYWYSGIGRYKVSKYVYNTISDGQDHTVYVWVRTQDKFGNWSKSICQSIDVYLSKPSTDVEVLSDVTIPGHEHNVTVTGPAARESDSAIAYTRITMTVDKKTYFRIVKTGESINVFDFDGTWYQGTVYNGKFKDVTEVTDFSFMHQHYGDISLKFESAYASLDVVDGGVVKISDPSYVEDSRFVSVPYAGIQPEGVQVHKVEFDNFLLKRGVWQDIPAYSTKAIGMTVDMVGAMIEFSISNVIKSDWGLVDLDADRSYVVIERIDDNLNSLEECVRYTGLSATETQTVAVPAVKDDGTPFESGAYRFRVGVYQKGSDCLEEFVCNGAIMVLDAGNNSQAGLWGYTIMAHDDLSSDIRVMVDDDNPIQSFGVSASRLTQTYRDREFAEYTVGLDMFQLYVGAPSTAKTIYGIQVDTTVGVRFWNAAANPTEEELEAFGFLKPGYNVDTGAGNVQVYIGTYGVSDICASVPQGADGLDMDNLPLHLGMNTICCQTINSAGIVSAVTQFHIYVTDTNPTIELSVDSYVPSLRVSEIEGQTNVDSITYRVDEAFSPNGDIVFEVVQRNPINNHTPVIVNGVEYTETNMYNYIVVPLKVGDLVTIKMDSYSNVLDNAKVLFVARDVYGAVAVVTPELGEVYRDGYYTNAPESVRFGLYDSDPFKYNDIWTGITCNEPVEEYNSKDASEKLNGEDIEGKFVTYVYGGEPTRVLEIISITNEDLYVNKYNIESNDISLGKLSRYWDHYSTNSVWSTQDTYSSGTNLDLLVWEEATIEISGDGIDGTVTLPYGASTPNGAGLLWFEYDEYGRLELAFADPISETEYDSDHRLYRSYTIKVKDIGGNEHIFTEEYTNQYVHYTDGGASLVYGTDDPVYGVDLLFKVYLADGGNIVHTNMFKDGTYEGTFTDAYGVVWPVSYELTDVYYSANITFSTLDVTMSPVVVTITSDVVINITDYDESKVTIENNGTTEVVITAKENTYFYIDNIGRYVDIENIFAPSYDVVWSLEDEVVENGGDFAGPVTVTLLPAELDLYYDIFEGLEYDIIDRYTGSNPTFTFYYGDSDTYTFKAEELAFVCGDETLVLTEDITVELPVTIIETAPFVPGLDEEDYTPVDEDSPEVKLLAYTQQNGLYVDTSFALKVINNGFSYLSDDYGYTVYETAAPIAATSEFVNALGWGSAYRFLLEVFDSSAYRFIIKDGLYVDAPAYDAESDVIDGVSLVGRQLTVTAPSAFTVFAVDENGFATAIPLDLANIGVAPVPSTIKVPVDGGVRIYLTEPVCGEGQSASELAIVPSGYDVKVDNNVESKYYGLNYITVAQNGVYNIYYSYMYTFDAGKTPTQITGSVSERVIEIRNDKIYLVGGIKWSANAAYSVTNSNVTATMQFSQPVSAVKAPADFEGGMEVRINGTIVTVRYDGNCDAVRLTVVAIGGTDTAVDLAAVTNVDKTAPTVSLKSQTLSQNGKTVLVVLHTDEKTLFAKTGNYGTEDEDGYIHSATVNKNGKYTYTFTDMAGNISTIEVVVNSIVEGDLTVEYSTDGVTPVRDPLSLNLNIGDKIYVRANRSVKVNINGGKAIDAEANTWVELTVTEGMSGLWPIIRTADNYGNVVLGQLGQVKLPDTKAPVVALDKNIIVVKVGTSVSELEELLRANIAASDVDPDLTYTFEYSIDLNVSGSCQVTYRVSDSSGNTASVNGILRVSENSEPVVTVNGELVVRDTIYVAEDDTLMLSVELLGEPYSVVYKSGLKSVGQMKIGVTDLARNATTAEEILLPFEESGYYTVCIITQSRDYYRIQIYVQQ